MDNIKDFLIRDMDSILDAIYDDVLIADGNGIVLKVSPTFENVYGIWIGNTFSDSFFKLMPCIPKGLSTLRCCEFFGC